MILELSGHLIADEADQLFKEQIAALVVAGWRQVLVDLKDVTYMDSGGVGALVTMYRHVLRRGGQLKLLCPSGRVCKVLEITHLLQVFEVFELEEPAIQSFTRPAIAAGITGQRRSAG
jgi:anti-sigma B factor antagonist